MTWVIRREPPFTLIVSEDGKGPVVCVLADWEGNRKVNAALVCAAPELLEHTKLLERALVWEINKAKSDGDTESERLKTVTLNLVRKSIAAAEGR